MKQVLLILLSVFLGSSRALAQDLPQSPAFIKKIALASAESREELRYLSQETARVQTRVEQRQIGEDDALRRLTRLQVQLNLICNTAEGVQDDNFRKDCRRALHRIGAALGKLQLRDQEAGASGPL